MTINLNSILVYSTGCQTMIAPYLEQKRQNLEKNEFIFRFYDEKDIRIVDLNNECEIMNEWSSDNLYFNLFQDFLIRVYL